MIDLVTENIISHRKDQPCPPNELTFQFCTDAHGISTIIYLLWVDAACSPKVHVLDFWSPMCQKY
jgi:hypothetical protein